MAFFILQDDSRFLLGYCLLHFFFFLSLFFNSKATKPQFTSPKRVIWEPELSGFRRVMPGMLVVSE